MNGVEERTVERARRVRLVAMDVDGVLTDGRLVIDGAGGEARSFFVRDGLAIRLAQGAGLEFAIISGRSSEAVRVRAAELKIAEVHQGVLNKLEVLREVASRARIDLAECCFIGDDLIDVPALRGAGLGVAPADADETARSAAHYVTRREGGHGAVRETIELILRAGGRWESLIESWFGEAAPG